MAGQCSRANITVSIKLWPLTPGLGISQSARQLTSYILIGGLHNQASYLSYLKWNELDSWSEPRLIWHRVRVRRGRTGKVGAKVPRMHRMLHSALRTSSIFLQFMHIFVITDGVGHNGGILIKILGNSEHSFETQNTCNEAWRMSPGLSFSPGHA